MYIKNRVLFWFPLAVTCFAMVWGFWPPVTDVLLSSHFTRVGFVLTTGVVFLLWAHAMKTADPGNGKLFAFEMVLPIFALLNLMTTIEQETPLHRALLLNAGMLVTCGLGLVLLFGIGYGSRPQGRTVLSHTTSRF